MFLLSFIPVLRVFALLLFHSSYCPLSLGQPPTPFLEHNYQNKASNSPFTLEAESAIDNKLGGCSGRPFRIEGYIQSQTPGQPVFVTQRAYPPFSEAAAFFVPAR